MLRQLVIAVLLLTAASVMADQRTVTSEGAKWRVILKDDGTWVYADSIPLGHNYGVTSHFRSSILGMSKTEVRESIRDLLPKDLLLDTTDDVWIYKGLFAGFEASVWFYFVNDRLALAQYMLPAYYTDVADRIQRYASTRDSLTAKYGIPMVDDTTWTDDFDRNDSDQLDLALYQGRLRFESQWVDQTTRVTLCLGCKPSTILNIKYSSLAHRGMEESFVENPLDTMQDTHSGVHYLLNVRPFKDVRVFDRIRVHLDIDPNLGLDEQELVDYATLRFKNNFANYRIDKDLSHKSPSELTEEQKLGSMCFIQFNVWTVGSDYPVAYHIEITCSVTRLDGSWDDNYPYAHQQAMLGYCSMATLESEVKTVMDSMMEEFALKFFKAKGEI